MSAQKVTAEGASVNELAKRARMQADWYGNTDAGPLLEEMADALDAATLTATEDALYIRRMEAERDAAHVTIRALTRATK